MTGNRYSSIVILEGADGVGKSTLCKTVQQHLKNFTSYHVEILSPSLTPSAEIIKQHYLNHPESDKQEEQRLWLKTMEEVVEQIKEKEKTNKRSTIYLIDRWTLSTLVYQGLDLTSLPDYFKDFNARAILRLFLDAPDTLLDVRIQQRGIQDKYEDLTLQKEIRARYRQSYTEAGYTLMNVTEEVNNNTANIVGYIIKHGTSEHL